LHSVGVFNLFSALYIPSTLVSASSPVGISAGLKVAVPKLPSFKGKIGTGKQIERAARRSNFNAGLLLDLQ
jgi:hypothetical protein